VRSSRVFNHLQVDLRTGEGLSALAGGAGLGAEIVLGGLREFAGREGGLSSLPHALPCRSRLP